MLPAGKKWKNENAEVGRCTGCEVLSVENLFLIYILNLTFQFKAVTPCPVAPGPDKDSLHSFPTGCLSVQEGSPWCRSKLTCYPGVTVISCGRNNNKG